MKASAISEAGSFFPTTRRIFGEKALELISHSEYGIINFCEAYESSLKKLAVSECRRCQINTELAEEFTQVFFLEKILNKRILERYKQVPGKPFRSYLVTCFKRAFSDWRDKQWSARTQGVSKGVCSLDEGVNNLSSESISTPDQEFEKNCADQIMKLAYETLKERRFEKGEKQAILFDFLWKHLSGDHDAPAYREIAIELGTTEQVIKNQAGKLKLEYQLCLKQTLGASTPHADIDSELKWLKKTISQ